MVIEKDVYLFQHLRRSCVAIRQWLQLVPSRGRLSFLVHMFLDWVALCSVVIGAAMCSNLASYSTDSYVTNPPWQECLEK